MTLNNTAQRSRITNEHTPGKAASGPADVADSKVGVVIEVVEAIAEWSNTVPQVSEDPEARDEVEALLSEGVREGRVEVESVECGPRGNAAEIG